jgi:uncharacterized protein YceK
MKRFFAITMVLMLILMSIGCATVPSYTTGTQDLSSTVGNRQFVGDISPEARNQYGWTSRGGW